MAQIAEITEELEEYSIHVSTEYIKWALKAAGWGLDILKKDLVSSIAWSALLTYILDVVISDYLAPKVGVDPKKITWGTTFGIIVLITAIDKLTNVLKNIEDKQGIVFIFKIKTIDTGHSIVFMICGFEVETY